ncbi:hypothetical protein OPU71_17445 [Niveibacterium sp. 24ML]|uniref:hypothetical protein n=1 Tax=Niveibacterium sp. 24ML TaxID=2985512 RepID=UPI00226D86AE|nr:hypothetical protein [Niveibacterium sp. 24ML]MCX9157912.1 hypothetical protein [Niveibacterium sp. 24ML]
MPEQQTLCVPHGRFVWSESLGGCEGGAPPLPQLGLEGWGAPLAVLVGVAEEGWCCERKQELVAFHRLVRGAGWVDRSVVEAGALPPSGKLAKDQTINEQVGKQRDEPPFDDGDVMRISRHCCPGLLNPWRRQVV